VTATFDPRKPDDYDWEHGPTPPLDQVLAALTRDHNLWWRIPSGHHENLFDEATDRIATLGSTVERVMALADELDHDAFRPERGRETNIETRRIHTRLRRILNRTNR